MNPKFYVLGTTWAATLTGAYVAGNATSAPPAESTPPAAKPASAEQAITAESTAVQNAPSPGGPVIPSETEAGGEATQPGALETILAGDMSREAWMKATLEAMSYDSAQLESALARIRSMPPSRQRNRLIYDLFHRWGQVDGDRALQFAESLPSLQDRNHAVGEVLEGWASQDSVSALAWLEASSADLPARVYSDYLDDIIEGFASTNPTAAFQYAKNLPEDTMADRRNKERAMREVVDAMVEQNRISEAIDMTMTMDESRSRNETLEEIVDEWAEVDPLAARDFVESMRGDPAFDSMQRDLLREWAENDPVAAAEYVDSLDPDDPNLPSLATSLVERWTRYDLDSAAQWLNSIPPSPEMDRAVAIFSMRAAQDDPGTALTSWVPSISDSGMQDRLTRGIAPLLKEQNPEAFEEYLSQSDFSEEFKEQLRNAEPNFRRRGRWW